MAADLVVDKSAAEDVIRCGATSETCAAYIDSLHASKNTYTITHGDLNSATCPGVKDPVAGCFNNGTKTITIEPSSFGRASREARDGLPVNATITITHEAAHAMARAAGRSCGERCAVEAENRARRDLGGKPFWLDNPFRQ